MSTIDYRKILKAYIEHVWLTERAVFLPAGRKDLAGLNPAEKVALYKAAAELDFADPALLLEAAKAFQKEL
jgi:hypothetical protein